MSAERFAEAPEPTRSVSGIPRYRQLTGSLMELANPDGRSVSRVGRPQARAREQLDDLVVEGGWDCERIERIF